MLNKLRAAIDQFVLGNDKKPESTYSDLPELKRRRKMLGVLQQRKDELGSREWKIELDPRELARELANGVEGELSASQLADAVDLFERLTYERYVHGEYLPSTQSVEPFNAAPQESSASTTLQRPRFGTILLYALTNEGLTELANAGNESASLELTRRRAMLKALQQKRQSHLKSFAEGKTAEWQIKLTLEDLANLADPEQLRPKDKPETPEELSPEEFDALGKLNQTEAKRLLVSLQEEHYVR